MPNWMTTRCKAFGTPEQIQEFCEFAFRGNVEDENLTIDFNKIVPMPKIILESVENNKRPENFPCMNSALLLLLLNGADQLPYEVFFENPPGPSMLAAQLAQRDELLAHTKELLEFLDAINPKTGVSTQPLSGAALIGILRATTLLVLGREDIALKELWCKNQIIHRAPEKYTKGQLDGAPLTDLAKIWATLPGFTENLNKGIFQLRILAETGYSSWYEWSVVNWGTKWPVDSIDVINDDDTHKDFIFETAWSFPEPIFRALGEKFPEITLWCARAEIKTKICGYGYFTAMRNDEPGGDFSYFDDEAFGATFDMVFDAYGAEFDDEWEGDVPNTPQRE